MDETGEIPAEKLEVTEDQVEQALREFRQGDILDVAKLTWLYSPDSPNNPQLAEQVPAEEPVMTEEARITSGLSVIVTQTCDVHRLPSKEQFVLLAPLRSISEDDYRDGLRGRSVRFFSYPDVSGHEDKERLALDATIMVPLEKMALLSEHIERIGSPLTQPRQADLLTFLAARLGRAAFPDEIVAELLEPLETAIKRVVRKYADFFDAVIYYGLSWTPGKELTSLLVLTSQRKREGMKVDEAFMERTEKKLQAAADHFLRDGDYDTRVFVQDVEETGATELLERHELFPDLHGAAID